MAGVGDIAAQGYDIHAGNQTSINWKQTGKSTLAGGATGFVMGGAMGMFSLTSAGQAFGKWMSEPTKLDLKAAEMVKSFWGNNRGSVGFGAMADKVKTLYHYTNEKGMNAIVESQKLNPSLKTNNPKDARYGNGQYLSDIEPSAYSPAQLAKKFINIPNQSKYTHYVEIDITDLDVIQGRDGVFVIPNESPLDLIGRIVNTGQVGTTKGGH